MTRSLITVALAFAAVTIQAAAPLEPPPEPIVIKIADMHREFVHVHTREAERGARLTFFFERKTRRQANGLHFRGAKQGVRIMDGQQLIAQCKSVGTAEWSNPRERTRYGLILGFDSIEEANRVAQAIRPFLK